jgi:hypothetical protein
MLGTLGIRKSHPPRTSCTALLTSRADDEAIKAGSQPLSIRDINVEVKLLHYFVQVLETTQKSG